MWSILSILNSTSREEKFLHAVNQGDLKSAKKISKNWEKINFEALANKEGATPMHFAAQSGNGRLVEWLIKKGAKVDAPLKWIDWTPLKSAAQKNHSLAVRYLLDAGANINPTRDPPLRLAYEKEHYRLALYLIARGADRSGMSLDKNKLTRAFHQFKGEDPSPLRIAPREIWLMLFTHIPGHELMSSFRLVCKSWNRLIINNISQEKIILK